MIGYGVVLLTAAALSAAAVLPAPGAGLASAVWIGGGLMVAAGFCSAQGRRSLRLSGLYVGIFTPLFLAGIFTWQAAIAWQAEPGSIANRQYGILCSAVALLSVLSLYLLLRFRPREGIESRGYAVSLTGSPEKPSGAAGDEPGGQIRRSEAG
jgi:hypothetical protein